MKLFRNVLLAFCAASGLCAAELQLAKDGRAFYTIVERPGAAPLEKAAAADLKLYLDKITGADFKIGKADSKRIFIGVKAPGDNRIFAKGERRIRAVNGDLYLYGGSADGAPWAVYDLLEEHLGCRWFTAWGDEKIPRNADLSIPELDFSKTPPFWRFETASLSHSWRSPKMRDFLRRRRVHITPDKIPGDDNYLLGFPLHTFCKYLPPGNVPRGKFAERIGDAYKYFEDKKYFETHPEWFTMDEKGRRVWNRQLCLSNKELRKEFLKNLEIVIRNEYKGGDAVIVVDMNDRNTYLCKCPECKKLIDKYETAGGPLYDYLIELSGIFAKKYPRITIRSLAYGCSLTPPNCDLPENVMMWYAPLTELDYLKNYNTTANKKGIENLKKQAARSKALWKWMYVTHFFYGHPAAQLAANMQRLADNLRICHENNVRCIMTEIGYRTFGYINFHEMRMNMIYAIKEDLNADEKEINREFMEFCYGKAADKIAAFLQELEDLGAKSTFLLNRRSPRPWAVEYLTPANLIRWEKDFDEMEKLVSDNPRQLFHVKKARLAVDQTMLGKWRELRDFDKSFDKARYQAVRSRYLATVKQAADEVCQDYQVSPARLKRFRANEVKIMMRAVKLADENRNKPRLPSAALRPLPSQFDGIPAEKIMRIPFLPKDRSAAPADPDGAFGVSMPGNGRIYEVMNFGGETGLGFQIFKRPLRMAEVRKQPLNKFNYYYLGPREFFGSGGHIFTIVTKKMSEVFFGGFEGKAFFTGDVYISVKYDGKKMLWLDEIVVVLKD